jgi:hypothetical protein
VRIEQDGWVGIMAEDRGSISLTSAMMPGVEVKVSLPEGKLTWTVGGKDAGDYPLYRPSGVGSPRLVAWDLACGMGVLPGR